MACVEGERPMIYDRLECARTYLGYSKNLDIALKWLLSTDLPALEGRGEIAGEAVYYMVQHPELNDPEHAQWEAHRNYIDIQIGFEEGEAMDWSPLSEISNLAAYDPQRDAQMAPYVPACCRLPLSPERFVILFPQDAHAPCLRMGDKTTTHKLVVKVRV